jgi:hypothetical protein
MMRAVVLSRNSGEYWGDASWALRRVAVGAVGQPVAHVRGYRHRFLNEAVFVLDAVESNFVKNAAFESDTLRGYSFSISAHFS